MNEQISEVINKILSFGFNVIFPIGILYAILKEYKVIYGFISNQSKQLKDIKILYPILKRLLYPLAGLVFLMFSFSFSNFILSSLVPINLSTPTTESINSFWSFMKYQYEYVGVVVFLGFILSSLSLMVSAGDRFFVNLSKVLVSISIIYLIISTVIAFA